MFELKRSKRITEQIKIGEEIITIDLDVETISAQFRKCYADIIIAQDTLATLKPGSDNYDTVLEEYGTAIFTLIQVIFGTENADKIIAFYDERYVEMGIQLIPYIVDTIIPQINEGIKEIREKAKENYGVKKMRKLRGK